MGCWAIGGPYTHQGSPCGWGDTDDQESVRTVRRALDLGVTLFDTAACYGAGHSERILGEALAGRRDEAVIATKFGHVFDEETREALGDDPSPDNLRRSCESSLGRLRTDRIDLLQFHCGGADPSVGGELVPTLEALVDEGKIRAYGWSTDDPLRLAVFARGPRCAAVQQQLNVLEGNAETLAMAEEQDLASLNRGPLAKGLLTGKFRKGDRLPENDVRHRWDTDSGVIGLAIDTVDALREVLTSDGRTPAQGALAWLWARSPATIPIPGAKSVAQIEDNAGAMAKGPLSAAQMRQIEDILRDAGWERRRFA